MYIEPVHPDDQTVIKEIPKNRSWYACLPHEIEKGSHKGRR